MKMADSGVDYYFLRSKRDGYLLVHDNYLFQKSKVRHNKTYWRCVVRSPSNICYARAILEDGHNGQLLKLRESHNHPPDSDEIARRKFKLRMKQRLQNEGSLIPAPKLYKEEAEKAALAGEFKLGVPSYESLKRTIYSAKNCSRDVTLTPIVSEDLPITTTSLGETTNSIGSEQKRNVEEDSDEDTIVSRAGSSSILCMRTESPPDCPCPSYNVCVLCRDKINDLKSARNLPEHASDASRSSASSPCTYLQCDSDSMLEDDPIQALTRIAQNTEKTSKLTTERKNRGLLERLRDNVVIGDGGFVFSLEKRGYVKAGPWTPEAVVEHPDAVRSLHREFLRAGSDVMQAFTFYASDDKLCNRGNEAGKMYKCADINNEACKLAKEIAAEGDALVAGGISQTPTYLSNKGKSAVQSEFTKQVEVFKKNNVDFLICEYFEHIEEMEWAIEVCKRTSLPVASTMCIGPEGDLHGVSAGECAVRMAKAGADVVGLNCHFDPFMTLETIAIMKKALEAEGLKPYLMTQPLAFHTPDAGKQGFIDLPEFPFSLEPRVCTRWDMHRYAREAYKLGVRYIGGCCGFESYHIRAVAEELAEERGKLPKSTEKHEPWGEGLKMHTKPWVRARARKDYWQNINPSTGRPFSAAFSKPDNWGVTAGSEDLKQKAESTTKEELQKVFAHKAK